MTSQTGDIVEETIKLKRPTALRSRRSMPAPKQDSKGGLVILQEIFGLTDQLKGVVRAYARDGYDTIFPASTTASRPARWCPSTSRSAAVTWPMACRSTR